DSLPALLLQQDRDDDRVAEHAQQQRDADDALRGERGDRLAGVHRRANMPSTWPEPTTNRGLAWRCSKPQSAATSRTRWLRSTFFLVLPNSLTRTSRSRFFSEVAENHV